MAHTVDPAVAREAGFRVPVALSTAAWDAAVAWTEKDATETGAYQDEAGRLWDVLTMAAAAVRRAPQGVVCEDFTIVRVPRGVPYAGEDDDLEYAVAMYLPMSVIVGGTPTTATISLDDE